MMIFYILTPHKIEAHEYQLSDFFADDLVFAMQSADTKIANSSDSLAALERAYPKYHKYKVEVGKF